jgi:TerC family integral membrane protein
LLKMLLESVAPWAALCVALFFFLWLDLYVFSRKEESSFRAAAAWSIAWLVGSLLVAFIVAAFRDGDDAILYTTVYLIERALSLDNLFVFLILFAYFAVPYSVRPRLLFWGIVGSLALRAVFIVAGTALIHAFAPITYLLGASLIVLAWWVFQGVGESVDPDRNLMVRLVRGIYPVSSDTRGGRWFVEIDGKRHATPLFLCLAAIVFANVAFALDSIPAAFAITDDPLLIWMGNIFALLGLRALFVLVESLIARFRYLDQTIALVLGLVGVKLLIQDVVEVGPVASLLSVAALFVVGITASLLADRGDPDAERKRQERREAVRRRSGQEVVSD